MLRGLLRKTFNWGARTPLFPQLEVAECGVACLDAILAYYGRWVTIEELRAACGVRRDGCSAPDIVTAGREYGLKITGWGRTLASLKDVDFPAILFLEFNHFVVLERIRRGRYYLNEPANGHRVIGEENFSQSYAGVVLLVEPSPDFTAGGTPQE